ncbi:MAG: hypothetical protein IPO21_10880 [Bacteroidales bacterium]|nr:hypothetical protein [Bacteroidales bacterium]
MMNKKNILVSIIITLLFSSLSGQNIDSVNKIVKSKTEQMLLSDRKLQIGGYGEVHANKPLSANTENNASLDVHRMVLMFGYNFNQKIQFVSEIEFEHVVELYVEQAFLQYRVNEFLQFRAGLVLIPVGIINEIHEPTTFNGVERPLIDNVLVPTTWREIGFGVTGTILAAKLKYQAYLVNGFNGYDGVSNLNGKNGFRKARQKGAESYMSSPNFVAKIDHYGIKGLNIGASFYFGNTQSVLYDGIEKSDEVAQSVADSSVVGISLIAADAKYSLGGLRLKGQLYYSQISNTQKYNEFTAKNNVNNDLGSSMLGFYAELGYNVLKHTKTKAELIPFARYEQFDTHASVDAITVKNLSYNTTALTFGLTWKVTQGAVVKTDVLLLKSANDAEFSKVLNIGIGVSF